MKTEYDKTSDAKYIRIKKGKIFKTKKIKDWLFFDCAKNGDVVGIEILDASKHSVSLFTVLGKFFCYSEVRSKSISNEEQSLELVLNYPEIKTETQFTSV